MYDLHTAIICRTVIAFVRFIKASNVSSIVYQFGFLVRVLIFFDNPGHDSGSGGS